jgi:hypothetical protein
MRTFITVALLVLLVTPGGVARAAGDDLQNGFLRPPDSARPWVYWFWLNGNITKEGITADLEAMKRVGIGGVLIMEVDQGVPRGPVDFMSAKWRELFQHVVAEAGRLGLEVNMNDDAGWNGSGGPWIKPEQAMQKVTWSETNLPGHQHFEGALPQPPTVAGYYRDIAVQAFPTPAEFRIDRYEVKAAFIRDGSSPDTRPLPPGAAIRRDSIVDLTAKMDASGRLVWDVPEGKWTVLRMGHTPTGAVNAPAPASGTGLECDKLSREGIEANFDGMMGKLITDVGPAAGKTLVATHIDSWENGSQNWTPKMREEFRRLRGYDLMPYLPVMTGRVVDSLEVSERFLWDLRQTVSDLVVENYAGRMEQLAKQHGLRLSIEAYGGPCDDLPYAGRADEPMAEFWVGGGAMETVKEMASAVHTYGKRILGAESFTATDTEKWLQHPASIKSLGDQAFCDGVSRYVFHRYAMQPWLGYKPGMTMGPWGIHYERTETWWEQTPAWHRYISRCQYMLRQGLFVADIAYLMPEASPQGAMAYTRSGYDYDLCSPEVLLKRMTVRGGRLVLPDGMSYRILALPSTTTMTPALLRRIKELMDAGATVVGPRPVKSPSLSDYPQCDEEVRQLAGELWDSGKIITGKKPEQVLREKGVRPDFKADRFLRYIHRRAGSADIYFVAYSGRQAANAVCEFRVTGRRPELWHPDTGVIERVAVYEQGGGVTRLPIRFDPSGSVFVVFRQSSRGADPVVRLRHNGRDIRMARPPKAPIIVRRALWGPPGDPQHTKDVTDQVRRKLQSGAESFVVAELVSEGDPAVNILKTLRVEYEVGGKTLTASATDPEMITFEMPGGSEPAARLMELSNGRLMAEARQPGVYEATTKTGKSLRFRVPALPPALEVGGPWKLSFAPGGGAPASVTLDRLVSWTELADPGVKYFSGTANYIGLLKVPAAFRTPGRRVILDLGDVQVMARVNVGGKDFGLLWKPPYRVDITDAPLDKPCFLQIAVTNLWPNRMIGDEQLPEDSPRNPGGTLREWPQWVLDGKPSPTGRYTFTTWRLWQKGAPLLESGLLGPVTLQATREVLLP